jgi:hypothetical protein
MVCRNEEQGLSAATRKVGEKSGALCFASLQATSSGGKSRQAESTSQRRFENRNGIAGPHAHYPRKLHGAPAIAQHSPGNVEAPQVEVPDDDAATNL